MIGRVRILVAPMASLACFFQERIDAVAVHGAPVE
jgi:hypothetical protein